MKAYRYISTAIAAVMLLSGSAVNAFAESAYDEETSGCIYCVGGIDAPEIVSASKGGTYIKLRWSKVADASGYKVYRKTKSGYKCLTTIRDGGKTCTCLIDGLKNKTKYTFRVKAFKKSNGKLFLSEYSPARTIKTGYGKNTYKYSNKAFSLKADKRLWNTNHYHYKGEYGLYDEADVVYLEYKDSVYKDEITDSDFYDLTLHIESEKVLKEERNKSLKYFTEKFIDVEARIGTFYEAKYGRFNGKECAYLYDINKGHGYPSTLMLPYILMYENGNKILVLPDYELSSENAEKYKKIIKEVYKTVTIK